MQLYKKSELEKMTKRPIRELNMNIEEKPERPKYEFKKKDDRRKYIELVKSIVRGTPEYRSYVSFLKRYKRMNSCVVYPNLNTEERSKYSIEIHHEPLALREIINIVLTAEESVGRGHNPYKLANKILELHYDNKVGLINLAKTPHEMVESGKIFIPLQLINPGFMDFIEEYEDFIDDTLKAKLQIKIEMSRHCDGSIVSDCLDSEFTYINVEGMEYPTVPKEWADALKSLEVRLDDDENDEVSE